MGKAPRGGGGHRSHAARVAAVPHTQRHHRMHGRDARRRRSVEPLGIFLRSGGGVLLRKTHTQAIEYPHMRLPLTGPVLI